MPDLDSMACYGVPNGKIAGAGISGYALKKPQARKSISRLTALKLCVAKNGAWMI
jgi:hypothetical protein